MSVAVAFVASAFVAVSKIPAVLWLAVGMSPTVMKALVVLSITDKSSELILLGTSALSVAVPAVASAFVAISIIPATVSLAGLALGRLVS